MAKILLVDDQEMVCELLTDFLEPRGHTTVIAGNVDRALALFGEGGVDLVVTDVVMPGKSGADLLREVKRQSPNTPVIIMTGQPSVEAAVECLKCGAADFLSKPLDFSKLGDTINSALQAAQDNRGTAVLEGQTNLRVIAGYQIKRTLGYGNFGVVYLADMDRDGDRQTVALKVLREGMDGEARVRFTREARTVARLRHENIVAIYDFDVAPDAKVPYIAMEYVDGPTLRTKLRDQAPWRRAERVEAVRQIAAALAAVHAINLCHRDVKPENVLLTSQGTAKLTDFGIVRTTDSGLTRATRLLGTPAYMAPESFESAAVDPRADVFSLGAMAYELLLGQLPFTGNSITALALAVCNHLPKAPRSLDSDFPADLETILACTLRKDPEHRYPTAEALVADLEAWQAGRPVTGVPGPDDEPDWR